MTHSSYIRCIKSSIQCSEHLSIHLLKEAIDYTITDPLLLLLKRAPLPSFLIDASYVSLINFLGASWNIILDFGLLKLLKFLLVLIFFGGVLVFPGHQIEIIFLALVNIKIMVKCFFVFASLLFILIVCNYNSI